MTKADEVALLVGKKINAIQCDLESSRPILARLRRYAGKNILDSQEIWGYVLENMPESLMGKGKENFEPSEAEIAVHITLSLYALHQQGTTVPVSCKGCSFSTAVRKIAVSDEEAEKSGVRRRFDAALTSSDINELSNHMRGLVQLIRQSNSTIQADYPLLAKDLYQYQFPDGKKKVLMRWGQDYYRIQNNLENADKGEKNE